MLVCHVHTVLLRGHSAAMSAAEKAGRWELPTIILRATWTQQRCFGAMICWSSTVVPSYPEEMFVCNLHLGSTLRFYLDIAHATSVVAAQAGGCHLLPGALPQQSGKV